MVSSPSAIHLQQAVNAVRAGGVIAYATEAVWGLGCDPWSAEAVAKIWQIKRRDPGKGLILIASQWQHVAPLLSQLSAEQLKHLQASWPGPVTWLVPVSDSFPVWLRGKHESVALRVSAHPGVKALCDQFGGPLVSTSANRAGAPAARSLFDVRQRLGAELDYILPSTTGKLARPTEIRDLATLRVIRAG
ncbi:L-threonylcarbamoyladenylate synthase [Perlucidibaca aquatica]|jgi:L-threonylcarbamoyladenylate synthase|uniref:L-threonylcarbamoyladenylate synthase n=1 Tax=Perlucidibaca aquatica TaxID=1852776 RepID=UPI00083B4940|nr:L-threonylcarbamoyladenylate synthase [Perlucidibaca aquatica]